MKIKRGDLGYFVQYKDYIAEKAPWVNEVYGYSIYFFNNGQISSLQWHDSMTPMQQEIMLKGINALCNTNFYFAEDHEVSND